MFVNVCTFCRSEDFTESTFNCDWVCVLSDKEMAYITIGWKCGKEIEVIGDKFTTVLQIHNDDFVKIKEIAWSK